MKGWIVYETKSKGGDCDLNVDSSELKVVVCLDEKHAKKLLNRKFDRKVAKEGIISALVKVGIREVEVKE